jgi:hypothetical protein
MQFQPAQAQFQPAQAGMNGCLKAFLIVIAIGVVGLIGLAVLGVMFADEVADRTRVAGRDNGVSVTLREFDQIENGMSLRQVEGIFGGEGALLSTAGTGEFETAIYSWDGSGSFGANVNVTFQNDAVMGKAQFGLG